MTWKRGVDMLSFGGTKNGCWCAEAVVLFDKTKADEFGFIRKRAGQLFSKSRFVSAQFDAYFRDDLWLDLARHAIAMSTQLARVVVESGIGRLAWEPEANEVFVILSKSQITAAQQKGIKVCIWPAPPQLELASSEQLCRFVTSFATDIKDVFHFQSALQCASPSSD